MTSLGYITKKAQQRLCFLRRMRKSGMSSKILITFYSSVIESFLASCITVWYGSTTEMDRKHPQRMVKTAERIITTPLQNIHRGLKKSQLHC